MPTRSPSNRGSRPRPPCAPGRARPIGPLPSESRRVCPPRCARCRSAFLPLHPDLELHLDLRVQPHAHGEFAQRLQRLVEDERATLQLEVEPALVHPFHDVGGRDGSEKLPVLPGAGREREREPLELRSPTTRLEEVPAGTLLVPGPLLFGALHVRRARHVGESLRNEVVPAVACLHLYDGAGLAQVFDVLLQNELHRSSDDGSVKRSFRASARARRTTYPRCPPSSAPPRPPEPRGGARRRASRSRTATILH